MEICMYFLYFGIFFFRVEDFEDFYNLVIFEIYFEGWSEFVVQLEVFMEVLLLCLELVGVFLLLFEEVIFDDFMIGEEFI